MDTWPITGRGLSHIIFVNEPEFIHEILINQPQHFIKERTQRRMKMEGVLMLATIAQQWRLRFVPGQTVEVQPKITLRPKFPMMFFPLR